MRKLVLVLLVLALFSPGAFADIVIFKSGSAKEGIVEEETPTGIKIRIKNAVIGVSWQNIERIEYATSEENRDLYRKWNEEKKKRDEERKRKREEREKFEKQQRDKGLVQEGDRWITRKEKAELEQEAIRSKIKAQEAARASAARQAAAEAKEAEEVEEPDFLQDMTDEERRQYKEDIKKVALEGMNAVRLGGNAMMMKGRVTNNGQFTAARIYLEIIFYDKNGETLAADYEKVTNLGPGQSKKLNLPVNVPADLVGSSKMRVTGVEWR